MDAIGLLDVPCTFNSARGNEVPIPKLPLELSVISAPPLFTLKTKLPPPHPALLLELFIPQVFPPVPLFESSRAELFPLLDILACVALPVLAMSKLYPGFVVPIPTLPAIYEYAEELE